MQNSTKSLTSSSTSFLTLSEITSQDKSWKLILDDLFTYSRKDFIFDNLSIFQSENESKRLDVIYAKSLGRGKAGEADVSWGDAIAIQAAEQMKMIHEEIEGDSQSDRLSFPYTLALPFCINKNIIGVLVFIRFGGPTFIPTDIEFAQYLSQQVCVILQKKLLDEFSDKIQKQTDMSELQLNFINTISHELRNPLGFIKGYTTTLLREDTHWDKSTQTEFLRIIERETNHLQELIDNLLDSSRLQSGQMSFDWQAVRMDALVRDEVSRAQINNPNVVFHTDFETPLPSIHGDPNRLAQVIDNLINNSIKYAPNAEIHITIRHIGDEIQIDFRDTGPGVQQKYMDRIFERFFREPVQSIKVHGSGLGLSICKEIIEKHNGKISACCPPGWGLTFSISLPVDLNRAVDANLEKK